MLSWHIYNLEQRLQRVEFFLAVSRIQEERLEETKRHLLAVQSERDILRQELILLEGVLSTVLPNAST